MKNKLVLFIISIVLLATLVAAQSKFNLTFSDPQKIQMAFPDTDIRNIACIDEDALDFYTKTTTVLTNAQGENTSQADECLPDQTDKLREFFCDYQPRPLLKQMIYTCPYGCTDGACAKFGDLEFVSATVNPEEPFVNTPAEAMFTIKNPSQFSTKFSIKARVTKPSGEQQDLTILQGLFIEANSTKTETLQGITLDESGTWTVRLTLESEMLDTNPQNNEITKIIIAKPQKADLALTNIALPEQIFTTQPFDVVVTIQNFGPSSSSFDLNFELSDPKSRLIKGSIKGVADLQPNTEFQYTFQNVAFYEVGSYKLKLSANSSVIDENLGNNAQLLEIYLFSGEGCPEGYPCLTRGTFSVTTEKIKYTIGEVVKLAAVQETAQPTQPQSSASDFATPENSLSLLLKNAEGDIEELDTSDPNTTYLIAITQMPGSEKIARIIKLTKNDETEIGIISEQGQFTKSLGVIKPAQIFPKEAPGYIVKLKKESGLQRQKRLQNNKMPQNEIQKDLARHKKTLTLDHDNFKKKVRTLLKRNPKELGDLSLVANTIALQLTPQEAEEVSKLEEVDQVVENGILTAYLSQSVPQIGADQIWQLTDTQGTKITGEGITIGVIDTGIDYTHLDLGNCTRTTNISDGSCAKVIGGYDFVKKDNDPMDDHGHGTHVAATAAGNGILKGVAPNAKLYAYKVLSSSGSGTFADVAAAIERSVDPNQDGNISDRLDVISLSLGGSGHPDDVVSLAADAAMDAGVVVVIAAGNEGPGAETIGCPGCARKVITVGAVNKSDVIAPFSSRGPVKSLLGEIINKPDVLAPGVDICAAEWDSAWASKRCKDDKHVAISGTSMATPHVSGLVALILQANPSITPQQVKDLLKSKAINLGYDINVQGAGRVDALKSLGILGDVWANPSLIFVEDTPSQQYFNTTQQLKITNIKTYPVIVDLQNNLYVTGVSVVLDKQQVTLQPNETEIVSIAVSIDHNIAVSGVKHVSNITLVSGGKISALPLVIDIKNTLTSSTQGMDFDLNIPSQPSWTVFGNFSIKNLRQDEGASYTLGIDCCTIKKMNGSSTKKQVTGLSAIFTPNPLNLGPNDEAKVLFTLNAADNSLLEKGTYNGYLVLKSPLEEYKIPFAFTKFFRINLTYENIFPGIAVVLHNRKDTSIYFSTGDFDDYFFRDINMSAGAFYWGGSKALLLESEGPYDAITSAALGTMPFAWENLMVNGDNNYYINNTRYGVITEYIYDEEENFFQILYRIVQSDILHTLTISPTKQDGTRINPATFGSGIKHKATGFGLLSFGAYFTSRDDDWFNLSFSLTNFSDAHVFEFSTMIPWWEKNDYFFTISTKGLTEDIIWGTDPSNLLQTKITFDTNLGGIQPRTAIWTVLNWIGIGVSSHSGRALMTERPFTRTLNYMPMQDNQIFNFIGISTEWQGKGLFATPLWHLGKDFFSRFFSFSYPNVPPISAREEVHIGSNPPHWNGKIMAWKSGNGSSIYLNGYYGRYSFLSQQLDYFNRGILSPGYAEVYYNNVLQGSFVMDYGGLGQVITFPQRGPFSIILPEKAGYNTYYNGYSPPYSLFVKLSFDTTRQDSSPPAFKSFTLQDEEGKPIPLISLVKTTNLTFSLDAVGGSVTNVKAFYKNMTSQWEQMQLQKSGENYYILISEKSVKLNGKDRVSIKISALDDSNNLLETIVDIPLKSLGSMITNEGNTNLKGYLNLFVQKLVNSEWVTQKVIFKDTEPRTIQPGATLQLSDFWEGYVPLEGGEFRAYGILEDASGKPLRTTDGSVLEDYWFFKAENFGILKTKVLGGPALQLPLSINGDTIFMVEQTDFRDWAVNNSDYQNGLYAIILTCNISLNGYDGGCLLPDRKNVLMTEEGMPLAAPALTPETTGDLMIESVSGEAETPLIAPSALFYSKKENKMAYNRLTKNPETGGYYHDIYMYDLATKKEYLITSGTRHEYISMNSPLSNSKIVWRDGYLKLYMCDLNLNGQDGGCLVNDKKTLVQSNVVINDPSISGSRIVWMEGNSETGSYIHEVYMCDLNLNGQPGGCLTRDRKTRLTYSSRSQTYPIAFGDNIVWFDYSTYDFKTCSFTDGCTASQRRLNIGITSEYQNMRDTRMDIENSKLLWLVEDRSKQSGSNWWSGLSFNLYSYNFNTGEKKALVSNASYDEIVRPYISGDNVVWGTRLLNLSDPEYYYSRDYDVWFYKKLF